MVVFTVEMNRFFLFLMLPIVHGLPVIEAELSAVVDTELGLVKREISVLCIPAHLVDSTLVHAMSAPVPVIQVLHR